MYKNVPSSRAPKNDIDKNVPKKKRSIKRSYKIKKRNLFYVNSKKKVNAFVYSPPLDKNVPGYQSPAKISWSNILKGKKSVNCLRNTIK